MSVRGWTARCAVANSMGSAASPCIDRGILSRMGEEEELQHGSRKIATSWALQSSWQLVATATRISTTSAASSAGQVWNQGTCQGLEATGLAEHSARASELGNKAFARHH